MKNNMDSLKSEYQARRTVLATGTLSMAELFDKAMQLLEFILKNHIGKEDKTDEQYG